MRLSTTGRFFRDASFLCFVSMKRSYQLMSHSPKAPSASTATEASALPPSLCYIDFYSGIGGWTLALRLACLGLEGKIKPITTKCVGSYDHSDLCRDVYTWNFGGGGVEERGRNGSKKGTAVRIDRMQPQELDGVANVWMMSPPCQPHTRQHENQSRELDDPRSASFLNICGMLETLRALPKVVLLENVVGFESSESWRRFQDVLQRRQYRIGQFVLQPHQVGIPNDRPRFYAVAVLESAMDPGGSELSRKYFGTDQLHTSIPELDVRDRDVASLPQIREFLQPRDDADQSSSTTNDADISCRTAASLEVPRKVLERPSAWCFDIVTPNSQRSACFTSGYGSYVKGTGSILYGKDDAMIQLSSPEGREFNSDWMDGLDADRFRYFSGAEMARLMGFDDPFAFPLHITTKQQWKLLGNSLNVRIASRLVQLALLVANGLAVTKDLQDAPNVRAM
jgi:tRNA (cytosine38-C5)-methyltransferase